MSTKTTSIALLVFIATSAILTTTLTKAAYADENYLRGWYTLFARTHCAPGEDRDGGCFCNNPNACDISFTNDPRTNEFILLDIIKSQGNGHFIPDNLRDNFESISNSISNDDFDHPFSQCLSLEQNAVHTIHLGCIRLLEVNSIDNGLGTLGTNNDDLSQFDNHGIGNDNQRDNNDNTGESY